MGMLIVYSRDFASWTEEWNPDAEWAVALYRRRGIVAVPVKLWKEWGYRPFPPPPEKAGHLDHILGNRGDRSVT